MLLKNTLISLGLLAFTATASAHSSIIEKEIVENKTAYLTIQVPHGCGHLPTKKITINIPNSQGALDDRQAFIGVRPVLSWYKLGTDSHDVLVETIDRQTGEANGEWQESNEVNSITISGISLPTDYVLKAQFRGKATLLPEGVDSQKISFDIIQTCTNNKTSEWTVENGKAASVTVIKAPEGNHGGH